MNMKIQERTSDGRWAGETARAGSKGTKPPRKPAKVDKLAQQHAAAAVKALVEVMQDGSASPSARISAAVALLQWGFGKAGPTNKAKLEEQAGRKADYVIRLSWGAPLPADDVAATD